jgi:hypothetical protein
MGAMTAAFAAGQLVGPLTVPYLARMDGDFSMALFCAAAALLAGIGVLPRNVDASKADRSRPLKEKPL